MEVSVSAEYSERGEEDYTVFNESQHAFHRIYSMEVDKNVQDSFAIQVRTERTKNSQLSTGFRISKSKSNGAHVASQVYSGTSVVDLQVKRDYSIWMVKILMFERMKGSGGFDPPSFSLYLHPKKDTSTPLSNDQLIKDLGLRAGETLVAVPSLTQNSVTKRRGSLFLGKSKSKCHANLSFAIGRGLSRGVVGFPCTFTIYPVSKAGRYILNSDAKFNIKFQRIRGAQQHSSEVPLFQRKQDKLGRTLVTFLPQSAGDYEVIVSLKKQEIALSPFNLSVINVESTDSGIREMAFGGWESEAASILSQLSEVPIQHELVFGVGMAAMLHLFGCDDDNVQKDMNQVISHLLETEENQIRIATEGSIQFVYKILQNPYWLDNIPICRFVGRVVSFALETNTLFRTKFLKKVGVEPLLSLASSSSREAVRYAVKCFFIITVHSVNITPLLKHGLFMQALVQLLSSDDMMVKRYCLQTFFNMTKSESFDSYMNDRKMKILMNQTKTKDRRIKLDVLIVLSQVNSPVLTKVFMDSDHLGEVFESLTLECIIQWWEVDPFMAENLESLTSEHLSNSETRLQSDLNVVALRFLNGVLVHCSQEELLTVTNKIKQNPEYLDMICHLCGSTEMRIQQQACKVLCFLAENHDCGREIIKRDGLLWLFGNFLYMDFAKQKYLFGAVSKLSFFFTAETTLPDEDLWDVFLGLITSPDKILRKRSLTIIGHLMKNPIYRRVHLIGNSELIQILLETARSDSLSLHPDVLDWEDIEGHVDEEAIHQVVDSETRVMKGLIDGRTYAIKKYDPDHIDFNPKQFYTEVAMMSIIQHPNLNNLFTACTTGPNYFFLAPLFERGSLDKVIASQVELNFDTQMGILMDIINGLSFLHSCGMIHRNLKPSNLLVDQNYRVSVGDFRHSRVKKKALTPTVGTARYMAPEVYQSTSYNEKADIYSFSIITWELTHREAPFGRLSAIEIWNAVGDGERPDILDNTTPLQDLIQRCWVQDPKERPSALKIREKLKKLQGVHNCASVPTPSLRGATLSSPRMNLDGPQFIESTKRSSSKKKGMKILRQGTYQRLRNIGITGGSSKHKSGLDGGIEQVGSARMSTKKKKHRNKLKKSHTDGSVVLPSRKERDELEQVLSARSAPKEREVFEKKKKKKRKTKDSSSKEKRSKSSKKKKKISSPEEDQEPTRTVDKQQPPANINMNDMNKELESVLEEREKLERVVILEPERLEPEKPRRYSEELDETNLPRTGRRSTLDLGERTPLVPQVAPKNKRILPVSHLRSSQSATDFSAITQSGRMNRSGSTLTQEEETREHQNRSQLAVEEARATVKSLKAQEKNVNIDTSSK